MDLGKMLKFERAMQGQAAGATDVNGDIIDTQGYDGCLFVFSLGAIVAGAATSCHVQQDTDSAGGTMQDLTGSKVTYVDTDDNKSAVIDVYKPRERYLRPVVKRATQNATIDSVVAILYSGLRSPTTNAGDVVGITTVISPAEGTP
jgi:hypothetical protein